jgi:NAD(P)-dependent dehydrogenase (short-subunit alcohol dehydrogenase family)
VRTAGLVADLQHRDAVDALVPGVLDRMGRLDIVVNNAGIIRRADAVAYPDADWDAVLEVNLSSAFRLCRAAGAHMLAAGYGKIVNIASVLSFQGGLRVPAYAAAKGGIAQLTRRSRTSGRRKGVNVNAIAPGYMRTDNTRALSDDPVRNRQILDRIPAGAGASPTIWAARSSSSRRGRPTTCTAAARRRRWMAGTMSTETNSAAVRGDGADRGARRRWPSSGLKGSGDAARRRCTRWRQGGVRRSR